MSPIGAPFFNQISGFKPLAPFAAKRLLRMPSTLWFRMPTLSTELQPQCVAAAILGGFSWVAAIIGRLIFKTIDFLRTP